MWRQWKCPIFCVYHLLCIENHEVDLLLNIIPSYGNEKVHNRLCTLKNFSKYIVKNYCWNYSTQFKKYSMTLSSGRNPTDLKHLLIIVKIPETNYVLIIKWCYSQLRTVTCVPKDMSILRTFSFQPTDFIAMNCVHDYQWQIYVIIIPLDWGEFVLVNSQLDQHDVCVKFGLGPRSMSCIPLGKLCIFLWGMKITDKTVI